MNLSGAIESQKKMARKVISVDFFDRDITNICGIDVSYSKNMAFCSAVIVNRFSLKVVSSAEVCVKVSFPYISGLLMLREFRPVVSAIKILDCGFDLLLIDGHGVLHPRRCGLASYVGVYMNLPSIGVAKNLICGQVRDDRYIEYDSEIFGYMLESVNCSNSDYLYETNRNAMSCNYINTDTANFQNQNFDRNKACIVNKKSKRVIVSTGNRISLKTAIEIVRDLILESQYIPEPLRIADQRSKIMRKKYGLS